MALARAEQRVAAIPQAPEFDAAGLMLQIHLERHVMKKQWMSAVLLLGSIVAAHASGNVALNADVQIDGTGFAAYSAQWGSGSFAPPSSVVDGSFLPNSTQWNLGTVFWSGAFNADRVIVKLSGLAVVDSFTLQADNNDDYQLSYLGQDDHWHELVTVSPHRSWGMDMGYANLATPVLAKAFAISAVGGDGYYSVSEFQANGALAVPEPESYAMMLLGLGVLGGLLGRRKRA